MDDIKPVIGQECFQCGEADEEEDSGVCNACGSHQTHPVSFTPCAKGGECEDPTHHYGVGKHVADVPQ